MAIWKRKIDTQILNERNKNTMSDHLGIEFLEIGEDFLTAKMPIDARNPSATGHYARWSILCVSGNGWQYSSEFLCRGRVLLRGIGY